MVMGGAINLRHQKLGLAYLTIILRIESIAQGLAHIPYKGRI